MQDTSGQIPLPPVPPPPSMQIPQRKRSRWWIPLAIIGGLLIILILAVGVIMSVFVSSIGDFGGKKDAGPIQKKTVLVLDFSRGVGEYSQPNPFAFGNNKNTTDLLDILTALKDAKTDDKIEGILIKAGGVVGTTKLTEIRDAVGEFKKSGKFVYAFMEGGTKQHYYLASIADSIFVPQDGIVEFNSFGATGMFFKQLGDKLGVAWHVEQFEEYKSAAEMTSRENWSAPAKQEVRELLEARQNTFIEAVAQGRKLDRAEVFRLMQTGVYIPDSLLKYKLIDGFLREDDLKERIARRIDPTDTTAHPKLRTTSINKYAARDRDVKEEVDKSHGIAIVYATGAINGGTGSGSGDGIYSRTLIKNLRKAAENEKVEAILLRIDSPGGSASASDDIWNTIREIRKKKPVYASMSDVAASGGYYIAMACDTIIAHPSTITGSIGVIMAIPNISGTMGKIGITIDTISLGQSAHFMNSTLPFTDQDKAKLREFGAGIYHRFVQKVADARKKDFESTRLLARGRVWTGQAAFERGLVDVQGGFQDALALIKKRIGADPTKKLSVYTYPEKMETIDIILKMLDIDSDDEDAKATQNQVLTSLLQKSVSPGMPVEELWNSMPADVRKSMLHTAAMADIGTKERTMLMMPFVISD